MSVFKKYMKYFFFTLLFILISLFFLTLLYYFDLISSNVVNYSKLFLLLIILFISSYKLGKSTEKNGWLEGIKLSLMFIIFFFLFSYLGLDSKVTIKLLLYDLILMFTSILGSMMGINSTIKK